LSAGDLETIERESETDLVASPAVWEPPASQPLLRDLLGLAAENRRLRVATDRERLESELDDLYLALAEQHAGEAERLQARKLAALAEFAAGAGHEINNPLAVISGQAQYLLRVIGGGAWRAAREETVGPSDAAPAEGNGENTGSALLTQPMPPVPSPEPLTTGLRTIIDQAQRIHNLLRDLWQFARPPQPKKQSVDLAGLVGEVSSSLSEFAAQRKVHLRWEQPVASLPATHHPLTVLADPAQLRTALSCLLRNAIEAAPADGWAALRLEAAAANQVNILIEDNGNAPSQPQRDHLFDPFFSGRPAGRGRGLGLPTAWRLARAHGGDVRFVGDPGEPTRVVMSLPLTNGSNGTKAEE
jgi:signal transduction histidine kinase